MSVLAVAVVLPVAACGSDTTQPAALSGTGSSSASRPVDPNGQVDEDTGRTITPIPVPTWDAAARRGALQAATTAMTLFARPGLEHDRWWRDLSPLLTMQAQQDYTYVDPTNIPVRKVTGTAAAEASTSAYTATVTVPTDVGDYEVLLIRQDGAAPWLVSRLTPPKGVK